jgi:hypothetical protein
MVLMLAYGVRVMDEKRKLWRAAEILNDVWNDAQYARDGDELQVVLRRGDRNVTHVSRGRDF